MARLITAGFETGSVETNGAVDIYVGVVNTVSRTGNYSLHLWAGGQWAYNLGADYDELYGRVAFRSTQDSVNYDKHLMEFWAVDTSYPQLSIVLDGGTQQLRAYGYGEPEGNPAIQTVAPLLQSGSALINGGRWYVIEFHVIFSAGTIVTKVDGVTDISYTGAGMGAGPCRIFKLRGGNGMTNDSYVDDVAVNSPDGPYQNTWPGLGGIFFLKANAEGDVQQWTPSQGPVHYEMVNEAPANTTDWVQALGTALELFNVEDPPEYITNINLVVPLFNVALAESGNNLIQDVVRQGTVDYYGAPQPVVTIHPDYAPYVGTTYYVQPNGSGAWGTAEVAALQTGVYVP
jgi:hypothetical protein